MPGWVARLCAWFARLFAPHVPCAPPLRLEYVEGDELPADLPEGTIVVAREDDILWLAGFRCPCGCERRLELVLLEDVRPRWSLSVDREGLPSLHPSVWINNGCRSHFWVRSGAIIWCIDDER